MRRGSRTRPLRTRHLPPLTRKRIGDVVDGYTITALVADTGVHRLYQARDNATATNWWR